MPDAMPYDADAQCQRHCYVVADTLDADAAALPPIIVTPLPMPLPPCR